MSKSTIKLCDQAVEVESGLVKASELYAKAELSPTQQRLYAKSEGGDLIPLIDGELIVIKGNEEIVAADIADSGKDTDIEIIDIREYARSGESTPVGKPKYKIRVDGTEFILHGHFIIGADILKLVDKNYEEWSLNRKWRGGRRTPVEPDEEVNVAERGVERFETVRKQAQQGT